MKDFLSYLAKNDPDSYQALQDAGGFEAAKRGDVEFVAAWQALARDTRFAEQQHNYIEIKKFDSAYNYAATLIPDLDQRSEVLKEIIWSGAVQHGKIESRVLKKAWSETANNYCAHNGCFNRRFNWVDAVDQWRNGEGATVTGVDARELNLTDAVL